MRISFKRSLAVSAVAVLALTACGDDGDDQAAPEDDAQELEEGDLDEQDLEDMLGDQGMEDLEDPNEDVEDGVYRGSGVILPVPDGWTMDQQAFAQGVVAAMSEDGSQQISARAVDMEEAEAAGQPMDLDTLLEGVREQIGEDAEVDEEVDLDNAERAHQLTYIDLPAQQEGAPESSATIVLAEDGNGLIGEFTLGAESGAYDADVEELLLATAGFDPDSEPEPLPEPQAPPQPEGGEGQPDPEDLEELEEMLEEQQGDDQG